MAANMDELRDQLRVSHELPLIQQHLDAGVVNMGTFVDLQRRLSQLLEVTLERPGDQSERVNNILAALQQLEQVAQLMAEQTVDEGDEGLERSAAPSDQEAQVGENGDEAFSPQELAFFAPTAAILEPLPSVKPIPAEMGPIDCPICFTDEVPVEEQRSLSGCEHRYCVDCLQHHFRALIDEGKVSNEDLQCPHPDCTARPELYELQDLLISETFEKYLQFMVLNDLKNDSNVRWCINKQCAQPIVWDADTPHVDCPACHTHFCFLCKQEWHEGKPCAVILTKEDQQFVKYVQAQGRATKPCPQCGTAIEKNEGCNHMTCPNCNHQWCWLCAESYSSSHYASGPCKGMQFTQADSLWAAKAKNVGKYVAIGAGAVVAAPLVLAGGVIVIAGGIIALPIWGITKGIKSLAN